MNDAIAPGDVLLRTERVSKIYPDGQVHALTRFRSRSAAASTWP